LNFTFYVGGSEPEPINNTQQTDTQIHRDTDRHTNTLTDTQTHRQKDTQIDRYTQTDRQIDRQTHRQIDRHTHREVDTQTDTEPPLNVNSGTTHFSFLTDWLAVCKLILNLNCTF
jgi:hypothetical protein